MTADTIALVIATLLTSSPLWEFVRSRINRPKPAPQPIQPKTRMQKIGGWFVRRLMSPWQGPLVLILLTIIVLVLELHITTPITRGVILRLSLAVALLLWWVRQPKLAHL